MTVIKKLFQIFLAIFLSFATLAIANSNVVNAYDALDDGYWVGMVSSASSVTKVASVSSYQEGIEVMNAQESTASNVATLFNKSTIIASKYAVLKLNTTDSSAVNSYMNAAYPDGTFSSTNDYFNGYYGTESPYIVTGSSESKAITYISGLKARISKTRNSQTQYKIVPISATSIKNYYYKYDNGTTQGGLQHYYGYFDGQTSIRIGMAPDFFESNTKYYSPDGHYFYTDYLTMIDDLEANTFENAINSIPYYNYYQFLPFHSTTNYTASDIDNYFKKKGYTSFAYTYYNNDNYGGLGLGTFPKKNESVLYNSGSYFMQMEQIYGINPMLLLAMSINETGWGRSYYAIIRFNLFGIAAYDSNPSACNTYTSVLSACQAAAQLLTGSYLNAASDTNNYNGACVGNKSTGANVKWASDPYWGEKAAAYYYQFDIAMGLKDYNYYTIGITTSTNVKAYSAEGSSTYPYIYGGVNHKLIYTPVLVTNASTNYYEVMADFSLAKAVDYQAGGNTSKYSFEDNHVYIKVKDLILTNANGSTYNKPQNKDDALSTSISFLTESYTIQTRYNTKVYTDAYLQNETSIIIDSNVHLVANEVATKNNADFAYKIVTDLKTGAFGWIAASDVRLKTGTYAIKLGDKVIKHDAQKAVVYSDTSKTSTLGAVTYWKEAVYILDTVKEKDTTWYKIVYNNQTGETGYVSASFFADPITHTVEEVPDPPTVIPDIGDLTYSENIFSFHSIGFNEIQDSIVISGLLAIKGINNTADDPMEFELLLKNELDENITYSIPLDRWLNKDEYPFDINAIPNNKYDYSGAWFKSTLNFIGIPQGNYSMTIVVKTMKYYSFEILSNTFSVDIVQRFANSDGAGIEIRTDYYQKTLPLQLFIRSDGLLSSVEKTTLNNAFIEYNTISLNDGKLNIKGTAFSYGGSYKKESDITRKIVLEDIHSFHRYTYDVGATDDIDYKVAMRVSDKLEKTKAWFDCSLDVSSLDKGTYAIYVYSIADNGLEDYGELADVFEKELPYTMTSNNKEYSLSLDAAHRYRLLLIVK